MSIQRMHAVAWVLACVLYGSGAAAVDGDYDTGWIPGGREIFPQVAGYDARLRDMAVQGDAKVVLAGDCDVPQAESLCMARLRADGALDLSFGPNQTGRFTFEDFPSYPPFGTLGSHGLAIQPDGRLVMAGFGEFNGANNMTVIVGTLARLSPDGATLELDGSSSYTPIYFSDDEDDLGNWVEGIALQPDGKIVLAGAANRAGSDPTNRDFGIMRLNADRSADSSFGTNGVRLLAFDQGGNNDDYGEAVALQPDGKIVVVGYATVTTGAGTAKNVAVARLNADGSFDNAFGNAGRLWFPGYVFSTAQDAIGYAVKIDSRGRIVIAGTAQFSGADHDFLVARLLPDGTLDPDFDADGIAIVAFDEADPKTDAAYDLVLAGDGTILLVGSASRSSTADSFAAARVFENGSVDTTFGTFGRRVGTFAPGSGFTDVGTAAAAGPGGIYVAGRGASGTGSGMMDFGIARLVIDHIFDGDFDPL